jgi:hypothetical protein
MAVFFSHSTYDVMTCVVYRRFPFSPQRLSSLLLWFEHCLRSAFGGIFLVSSSSQSISALVYHSVSGSRSGIWKISSVDIGRGLDVNNPSNECNNEYNHCASRDVGVVFVVERATAAEAGPDIAIGSPTLNMPSNIQHSPNPFHQQAPPRSPETVHTPLT